MSRINKKIRLLKKMTLKKKIQMKKFKLQKTKNQYLLII